MNTKTDDRTAKAATTISWFASLIHGTIRDDPISVQVAHRELANLGITAILNSSLWPVPPNPRPAREGGRDG